jgi:hypothetical protein
MIELMTNKREEKIEKHRFSCCLNPNFDEKLTKTCQKVYQGIQNQWRFRPNYGWVKV